MHDMIIRGGTVVDGTGGAPFVGDVAVDAGRITSVGQVVGEARADIDASACIVTPGFVDIHTHYDGQATWDEVLAPSCYHGVTTAVMGSCGVGFAPAAPAHRRWLLDLMEGVEDIPGVALSAGVPWAWESFPEYLEFLASRRFTMDVAVFVPHGPVRAHVMGARGVQNELATPEEIAAMCLVVREGLEAGAVGFSVNRTVVHRALNGAVVPGTYAGEDELFALGMELKRAGGGVFQLAPAGIGGEDLDAPDRELPWIFRLAETSERPVSFGIVQYDQKPDDWKRILELAAAAGERGAPIRIQVPSRAVGHIVGLQTFHPFETRAAFRQLGELPLEALVEALRRPGLRRRIIDGPSVPGPAIARAATRFDRLFPMEQPIDWEPEASRSVAALAQRQGCDTEELLYDLLLEDEGRAFLRMTSVGYSDCNLNPIEEMLRHPMSILGLGDGGAHVGFISDASFQTTLLTHWVRDRRRGDRLPLEWVVRKMTSDTATVCGLTDRGSIAVGKKADLNVIDLERLDTRLPEVWHDLPCNARRLVQRADGYRATIVSGEVVMKDGEETGARSGRLVRAR
jgi:N-acyl-D-aspartate/D-glutamate deacylase